MLDRIKAWCWHSLTIFCGYVQFVIGIIIAALPLLADILATTEVKAQILEWTPNHWDGIALMVIAVLTILARYRTL